MAIHAMATTKEYLADGTPVMVVLFKLTKTKDNKIELFPPAFKRYGFGSNVMRALGYSQRPDGLSYESVERDRFKDGPVYIQVAVNAQGKLARVQRYIYQEANPAPVEVIPMPELVEA